MNDNYFKKDEYWKEHINKELEDDIWIDEDADLFGATTTEAGKLVFTANAAIDDVSKIFTLVDDAVVATFENNTLVPKTVGVVQLESVGGDEPDVPVVDPDQEAADAVIAKIAAIGEVALTDECKAAIEAAVEAVLDGHGIFYDKTEVWIESEKLYEVLYSMEVLNG